MPAKNITSVSGTSKEKRKTKQECKYCGQIIESDSIFCRFCGERVARKKRTTEKKTEISVPKPKKRGNSYYIWLEKEKASVTEATELLCIEKARAIRAGFLENESKRAGKLKTIIEDYIEKRKTTKSKKPLSPTTLRGYNTILKNRFKDYMDRDVMRIDWQAMIDDELEEEITVKTVRCGWELVASALNSANIKYNTPTIPTYNVKEMPWLDYEQIKTFLDGVKDEEHGIEIPALLMLHSLRRSEAVALKGKDIRWNEKKKRFEINIDKTLVLDENNKLVLKNEGKSYSATRTVPVMIPRLTELLKATQFKADEFCFDIPLSNYYRHINAICVEKGLPEVGCHGLRRAFASLCYHLKISELACATLGGWSKKDLAVIHKHYLFLADKDVDQAVDTISTFYLDDIAPNLDQNLDQNLQI